MARDANGCCEGPDPHGRGVLHTAPEETAPKLAASPYPTSRLLRARCATHGRQNPPLRETAASLQLSALPCGRIALSVLDGGGAGKSFHECQVLPAVLS